MAYTLEVREANQVGCIRAKFMAVAGGAWHLNPDGKACEPHLQQQFTFHLR